MMIYKYLLFAGILISFLSCQEEGEYYYEYYPDGKVKYKIKMENDVGNGDYFWYYPNGNIDVKGTMLNNKVEGFVYAYFPNGELKRKALFKNNTRNGESISYYPNGNINEIEHYLDGKLNGEQFYYAEQDKGRLERKERTLVVEDSSYTLEIIDYDDKGKVKQKRGSVYVKMDKDTIRLGEEIKVRIMLMRTVYDSCELNYGNFDENFVLKDSTSFKVVIARGNSATIILKPTKIGKNYFRGSIKDFITIWKVDKKRIKKYNLAYVFENAPKDIDDFTFAKISSSINTYFEYEYYVERE